MTDLTEHRYSDRPARYYADGRRISKVDYDLTILASRVHCCFTTTCRPLPNGGFHRINHSYVESQP
jgi:hypothetical protein